MFYFGTDPSINSGRAGINVAFSRDLRGWTKATVPLYEAGGHPHGLDACEAHKVLHSLIHSLIHCSHSLTHSLMVLNPSTHLLTHSLTFKRVQVWLTGNGKDDTIYMYYTGDGCAAGRGILLLTSKPLQ